MSNLHCIGHAIVVLLTSVTVSVAMLASVAVSQEGACNWVQDCEIDLAKPGMMSDIVSVALARRFGKDQVKVREFLDDAQGKHETGFSLAMAAANHFGLEEAAMVRAVQEHEHINCSHKGGGEYPTTTISREKSDGKITDFASDVMVHVALHELGHGLVREFDLPILGNEETLADTFATYYVVTKLPDRALEILRGRVTSLMIEANEAVHWTVKGEHNSDARRAYQIVAIAIAANSTKFQPLAQLVHMSDSEKRKAIDYGNEIHRSWRRILKPFWMPDHMLSNEVRIQVDPDSIFAESLSKASLLNTLENAVRSFDWHSQITIRFSAGDGGAAWSRSRRSVTIRDEYIHRFNCQSAKHSGSLKN